MTTRKRYFNAPRGSSIEQRFWAKVDKSDECWLWTGALTNGYGAFFSTTTVQAHRYAYELLVGPIPTGLTLDHLCRVRNCVNPAHLEPVTNRENILRGDSPAARMARKTHCKYGHPFDEANTCSRPGSGRRCRQCNARHHRELYARTVHVPKMRVPASQCKRGHPFDAENTGLTRKGRMCRTCKRDAFKRWWERRKVAYIAGRLG